ncbi:MAG: alpha/beta fold hydrolase [Actinomycetota bacterium]
MPFVETDGARISYEVVGEGEPLLLIMGWAAEARMWMMQTPVFSHRYRVITFDNRGVGGSTTDGEFDLQAMARDARAVLDATGTDRAHILGISMGGAIAQHLVLEAPERVRTLTLAATWCARNAYLTRLAELGVRIYDELGPKALVSASMLWLFSPHFLIENAEFAAGIEAMFADVIPPRTAMMSQLDALLQHETRARLQELSLPTLVMVGRRDVLVPPELSKQIVDAVPHAEFEMLESGHAFNVEEADRFNQTVLAFLEKNA